ncbi:MAG TPA: glycosyltransferase family 39 protein [Candidatus Paceibacterota bacterium]|nr:glycosyltransferase family 39 protein [Candidatus Paceibacterota bacterium]
MNTMNSLREDSVARIGLIFLLIVSATVIALTSAWNDSLTFDEVPHIGAGYSYLATQEMRLNPEHPVLFKDIAALPLTLGIAGPIQQSVFSNPSWTTNHNDQWQFGNDFLFAPGNNTQNITRAARIPLIVFFIVASILVHLWTQKRFGYLAALIATIAFCFSPTILAHSRLVTNDMAVLCGVLISLFFFVRFLHNPTVVRTIFAGVTLGIALITKFSAVILIPFLFLLLCIYVYSSPSGGKLKLFGQYASKLVLIYVVACFGIIYPLYAFHISSYEGTRQYEDTVAILKNAPSVFYPIIWSSDKSVLRPLSQYALGVAMNSIRTKDGNTHYFLGTVGTETHASYFPLLYSLKETIPWLSLVLVSVGYGIFRTINFVKRRHITENKKMNIGEHIHYHIDEVTIALWIILYSAISIFGNLNIGLRHLLPIYPFIVILTAGTITLLIKRIKTYSYKQFGYGVLMAILLWHILEALITFPSYLSYFNKFAGGSKHGNEYVTDSNVDWGQDILRLKFWADSQSIPLVEADLFTSTDPEYYLGDAYAPLWREKYTSLEDFLARRESTNSVIAISYTTLKEAWATESGYLWLKDIEPTTVIGSSITVYAFN